MTKEDVEGAWEKGETAGHMKIVLNRNSGEILGAAIRRSILDTMHAKAPAKVLQRVVAHSSAGGGVQSRAARGAGLRGRSWSSRTTRGTTVAVRAACLARAFHEVHE
jgi:hypothetical protein